MEDSVPPFQDTYTTLLPHKPSILHTQQIKPQQHVEDCFQLPVIDLNSLDDDATCGGNSSAERIECMNAAVSEASREWGFFQVVNQGVPQQVLETLLREQRRVFRQPFQKKAAENILDLHPSLSADGYYRWGNRAATSASQLSCSEAFHIPVADISLGRAHYETLRLAAKVFATKVGGLAQKLAEILAQDLGIIKTTFFQENFSASTSHLRITRYPQCPIPLEVFGLIPHTDSDFLTVLYQDLVGGLQLEKDGHWFSIRPNPDALIVNIGDLFQAWSNGVYKSVKHRVVANPKVERFSVAYFYCPYSHTKIWTGNNQALYRAFTYEEYRDQIQRDVHEIGDKVGLSRFLL